MYQITDGPGNNASLSVTNVTAVEVKVGASPQDERKIIIIQPQDGKIYWGYSSGVTAANGFFIGKKQTVILEATPQLPIWIISSAGTVDVRIAEVS